MEKYVIRFQDTTKDTEVQAYNLDHARDLGRKAASSMGYKFSYAIKK